MGGNLAQQTATFENKIQNISEYLKEQVLTPAEQARDRLLAEANAEKERIIAQAEKKAEEIVRAAEEKARLTLSTAESSLRLAARQAIDTLKLALEKEVLSRTVGAAVREAEGNAEIMKAVILEVVRVTVGGNAGQVEVVLSDELKKRIGAFVKGEIAAAAAKGVTLSDDRVPSGFSVRFVDKGFSYEFTNEALTELLADYLRPELRTYLFAK